MSQSEDYLDGLLNSITKAKTDAIQVQEDVVKKQQAAENKKTIAPEEDFFTATGINVEDVQTKKSSHPYLRKVLSEEDFLRKFEEELESEDVDLFISDFEQEIDDEERYFEKTGKLPDSEGIVDSLINNIDNVVNDAKRNLEEEKVSDEPQVDASESYVSESSEVNENDDSDVSITDEDTPLEIPDEGEIDLSAFIEENDENTDDTSNSEGEDVGISLDDAVVAEEEPLDDSLKEFLPDDMDALDEAEYGDGEEPDLSGKGDLDLDNLLEGDDEDLLDIQSLLNGDEEGAGETSDIDSTAEETTDSEEEDKGKKKKKKGKKEKGEKKKKEPNPFVQKLLLILFGPPDEDDLAEEEAKKKAAEAVEITYDEDGNPIIPEGVEDPKAKKKREKEEKKAAKEAAKKEKEAAKKEKAKEKKDKPAKPAKPPKPKKEKKPKEPDNSPKIPISIIATFLLLSISIIGVVMVGMTFTGIKRHMSQAQEYFEAGNYIAAYEKLNGFDLSDEDVALMRNQCRVLADLQLCQQEYEAFISYEKYNYALDSLIIGIGRYEKYKDEASDYGVTEQYEAYGSTIIAELDQSFNLTPEEALAIYKQPSRHYYTIELRKVLRSLGLPDV